MIPSKFFDPPSSSGNASSGQQPQQPPRCAPPPLGMTGVMCKIGTLDIPDRGEIHYRIFRPRQLSQKPPLIVIHGGPLIPCNYLHPLAYVVVDRSIVVYDQLGCGQSSRIANYSVLTKNTAMTTTTDGVPVVSDHAILDLDGMVQDLDRLIDHWGFSQFHLLGHSFGGILLFEYLKYCQARKNNTTNCRGVILASAPTSTSIVEEEVQKLCQNLELTEEEEEEEEDEHGGISTLPKKVPKAFREKHECRLVPIPFPLMDSYSKAGPPKLRGLQCLGDYKATLTPVSSSETADNNTPVDQPPEAESSEGAPPVAASVSKLSQPTLVLRGQDDFVTEACVTGWDDLFQRVQHMTLAGCSHYGMLENEIMYGSVVSSFLGDCDKEA